MATWENHTEIRGYVEDHSSIGMTPYKALYDKKSRIPCVGTKWVKVPFWDWRWLRNHLRGKGSSGKGFEFLEVEKSACILKGYLHHRGWTSHLTQKFQSRFIGHFQTLKHVCLVGIESFSFKFIWISQCVSYIPSPKSHFRPIAYPEFHR